MEQITNYRPAYLSLFESGVLQQRAETLTERSSPCRICPFDCKAERRTGKTGICRSGMNARIAGFCAHLGEEDPLRGWRGSGTIFFSSCNMRCQYCQNEDISQVSGGEEVSPEQLAKVMLHLQEIGCHNINLVSPTHVIAAIVSGLVVAAREGLRLPLVYNTGGYDSVETLQLLDGIIDIYMPDMKYSSAQIGLRYSKARDYPRLNQLAVKEMHRQVGDLVIGPDGVAQRGLLVRHLVLPHGLAGTEGVVRFLAEQITTNTYINIMDQYRPAYNARLFPKISRPVSSEEYRAAVAVARQAGLHRLDQG
jgi:putative pyruvate formate lyase activating enzyme